ncbi:MAG: hypothetical protein M3Q15_01270 [Pseudomonadota bacterium]|nr:hypothetical protein [Pseudomonadota bacterium]
MRNVYSKLMTGSMIAASALLVVACGGGEDAEANNMAMTEMNATDTMMDGTTNDVTAIDAGTGADANMAMDANMTMDANMSNDMMMNDMNMTNGM